MVSEKISSNFFFFKLKTNKNSPAEFLSTASRHVEACEQRVRAAELSPSDYSLVVSAATALRLLEKKQEAEKWYRLVSRMNSNKVFLSIQSVE